MTSSEIRQQFIDFFKEKGHTFVPSSLVVPYDDPTLLFTNAGMNQFKDVFLGTGKREYTRAANTQKCIRAGGKHNDLDDVGHDTYHHTFFEMLGNWSFGDYFKAKAIKWAWELLVERWGLDADRLHATYFEGNAAEGLEPDDEARALWLKILPPERVHPGNKKDNFWEMGDAGPCGPCSEIHIDLTPDKSGASLVNAGDARVMEIWNLVFIQFNASWLPGGQEAMREFEKVRPPKDSQYDDNEARRRIRLERYGTDDRALFLSQNRKLEPLPARHVDTGMGLERLCAVIKHRDELQGEGTILFSNYGTDLFLPIIKQTEDLTGKQYGARAVLRSGWDRYDAGGYYDQTGAPAGGGSLVDIAFRVIADHLRCLVFAIADGATLSNVGRGYVLRRILRRAVRYGRQHLSVHDPFLHKLVPAVVGAMGEAFPELRKNPDHVVEIIHDEEESFCRTYERGIKLFEEAADYAVRHHEGRISGEDAFKLHDTYGFPIDLTELMAEERGLKVDIGEYDRLMEEARQRARRGQQALCAAVSALPAEVVSSLGYTDDSAKYDDKEKQGECSGYVQQLALLSEKGDWEIWPKGFMLPDFPKAQLYGLILDATCFYAEQGGQVGDRGAIQSSEGEFEVADTIRAGNAVVHIGRLLSGQLTGEDMCEFRVDWDLRRRTVLNHTSTHVMNWALREVLGDHVDQKGSLVDPDKTRFDFSHRKAVTPEEIKQIEEKANGVIETNHDVEAEFVSLEDAKKINTLRAVFGENYPDPVRVVSVGASIDEMLKYPDDEKWLNHSVEFCGGTHLKHTGEVELFRIIEETAVAKGIRRITAVTGERAKECDENARALLDEYERVADSPDAELAERVADFGRRVNDDDLPYLARLKLREKLADLQSRVKKYAKKQAGSSAKDVRAAAEGLLGEAESVGSSKVIVGEMPSAGPEQIREAIDYLRTEAGSAGICLGCVNGEKVLLFAAFTNDLVGKGLKAGDLIKAVAPAVGGGGGGKPELAQAGGKNPAGLPQALNTARDWLTAHLQP